ncbi:MAG: CAP domain-containing protein [bacterium]|nr:CAP domain-containing protein [bacterium]
MKKAIIAVIVLLFVVSAGIAYKDNLYRAYLDFSGRFPELQKGLGGFLEQVQNISTPPPLISSKNLTGTSLSSEEVIKFTNLERANYGLLPLSESIKLNQSAMAKAQDMLAKQYFEHESPAGERVSDLVKETGYKYIILGENLAMGGFENDQDLVQAWMNSPGHRENILNPNYEEIGVAAAKGQFEGRTIWMAVQHFGTSTGNCPEIDESFKRKIEMNQEEIEDLENVLDSMKGRVGSRKTADEYNRLVLEYNRLAAENKALVEKYNNQVREFNNCISSFQ